MSKSKTPITDTYDIRLKGADCHITPQEIKALRDIERELFQTKEESPSKAIEVIKELDKIVDARIKEREGKEFKAIEQQLCLDYRVREIELEEGYKKEKEALVKEVNEKLQVLEKKYYNK